MRRKEATHVHRRRHISNRHLSDKYYYAGEHETVTDIRLTQYNAEALHTTEIKKGTSSFGKLVDPNKINWFQVSGLTDSDAITRISCRRMPVPVPCRIRTLDAPTWMASSMK